MMVAATLSGPGINARPLLRQAPEGLSVGHGGDCVEKVPLEIPLNI